MLYGHPPRPKTAFCMKMTFLRAYPPDTVFFRAKSRAYPKVPGMSMFQRSWPIRTGPVWSGPDRIAPDRSGIRTGPHWSDIRTGPVRIGSDYGISFQKLPSSKYSKNAIGNFYTKIRRCNFYTHFFDVQVGLKPSQIDRARKMLSNAIEISSVDQF